MTARGIGEEGREGRPWVGGGGADGGTGGGEKWRKKG